MAEKLLVVGDSFMRPDPKYPGQHWSEMLPEYQIINLARDGNSLTLTHLNLYQGLDQHHPDAVVIGFTDPLRIEFGKNDYYTSCHASRLTADQAITAKYLHANCDLEFQSIKGTLQILSMLDLLQKKRVRYAFSLGIFLPFIEQIPEVLQQEFKKHLKFKTRVELSQYPSQKKSPIFHVDDLGWQIRYVESLREILRKNAVDN
jgi:hypothetical protein